MADAAKIVQALKASLNPKQQREAEAYLQEARRLSGFCPCLLQLAMSSQIDVPVRQAGAVLLKNVINREWQAEESIASEDKAQIRDSLIDAMRAAPGPLLSQLKVCATVIVQNDFPDRWPQLIDSLLVATDAADAGGVSGVVSLSQVFQFAKPARRQPLEEAMQRLLPSLLRCASQAEDWRARHQAAKALHSYTATSLPPQLLDRSLAAAYTQSLLQLLQQPDSEERWKAKKWALRSLLTWLERYGPADTLAKPDATFGPWLVRTQAPPVVQWLLTWLLQTHRSAPLRLLHLQLSFLRACVPFAAAWRLVKPQLPELLANVCFPLLCHSDEEAELWECDPAELVRNKFDPFDDFGSPDLAAEAFVRAACAKRRGVLDHCAQLCTTVLQHQCDPRQRDGALRMLGCMADLLLPKAQQVEQFMQEHTMPLFSAAEPFLRARACWLIRQFAGASLSSSLLSQMAQLARSCLADDSELPVRAEAAAAVQAMMDEQPQIASATLRPHAIQLMNDVIAVMRSTVCEHLNSVLQKLFVHFRQEVGPLSLCIVQQLADAFLQSLGAGADEEEQAVMAMGILSTLETIASVLEDDARLMSQLEPLMLQIVQFVVSQSAAEYLEEAISLADSLTCRRVSPAAWTLLPLLRQCIERDGVEYFCDVANPLYNFVTVDPRGLLAEPARLQHVLAICESALAGDCDEAASSAAKLLEVLLLQFPLRAQQLLLPHALRAPLARLSQPQQPEELRIACLLVVLAAVVHCPDAVLQLLQEVHMLESFVTDWLAHLRSFVSLHDRRVCVLALCRLMQRMQHPDLLPAALHIFKELEASYHLKRRLELSHSQQQQQQQQQVQHQGDSQELHSDEDEDDHHQEEYARRLQRLAQGESEAELDDLVNPAFDSMLEADDCRLDEFVAFKQSLAAMEAGGQWQQVAAGLAPQLKEAMQSVLQQAASREACGLTSDAKDPTEIAVGGGGVGGGGFHFGS